MLRCTNVFRKTEKYFVLQKTYRKLLIFNI